MTTVKSDRTNRQSGGMKTERGKAIVRHNACRHGILAELRTKYEGNAFDGYPRRLQGNDRSFAFAQDKFSTIDLDSISAARQRMSRFPNSSSAKADLPAGRPGSTP